MMNRYKLNIKLDYLQLTLRSLNVTQGIWLVYLYNKGFSIFEVGIFEAIFHISSMAMEIPTGILGDLLGRKFSRILGIISYLIYVIIIIYSNNVLSMVLAFIFCGTSYALESGSGEALIYDSLKMTNDEEKYVKINGYREIIFQVTSSIALVVGGYIALVSYNLNFWIVFIAFVTALIPISLMKETLIKRSVKDVNIGNLVNEHFVISSKLVFRDKNLLFLIIIGALMAAPVTSLFFYFQIHLIELNYSIFVIGILLAVHSVFGAVGGYFADKLERKFKEKLILYVVPIFIVISFWLIQIDLLVFLPFILLGLFDSVFYIVLSDYINRIVPSEQRATVLSFNSFAFSIIMILVFPLLGMVGDIVNLKFSFLILAILVTVFYISLLIYLRKSRIDISKKTVD